MSVCFPICDVFIFAAHLVGRREALTLLKGEEQRWMKVSAHQHTAAWSDQTGSRKVNEVEHCEDEALTSKM